MLDEHLASVVAQDEPFLHFRGKTCPNMDRREYKQK